MMNKPRYPKYYILPFDLFQIRVPYFVYAYCQDVPYVGVRWTRW